ncbi:hypothetical protein LSI54_12820 [Nesterenkonia sp. AY15]|uniref:hypothetical protein n=1 Tax=Nesterenkonia sp. AY15 TaxID=2901139 RepID=UPI001F4CC06E|nr:hypothetical protein [Nesterenkonia sp. AY15]MCH8572230.1 hypothetical protein [Nesterenkonia sp. AY15]
MPYELSKGEVEILRVVGSKRPGRITSVGGDLVLTTCRVIFTPLDTSDVSKLLSFGLGKAGADGGIVGIVDKVQEMIGTAAPIGSGALTELSRIEAGHEGSLLKPPTLVIHGSDGSSEEIGVLEKGLSHNSSANNRAARDRFIEATVKQIAL